MTVRDLITTLLLLETDDLNREVEIKHPSEYAEGIVTIQLNETNGAITIYTT